MCAFFCIDAHILCACACGWHVERRRCAVYRLVLAFSSFLVCVAYFLADFAFIYVFVLQLFYAFALRFLFLYLKIALRSTRTQTQANLRSTRDKSLLAEFFLFIFLHFKTHKRSSVQHRSDREHLCVYACICVHVFSPYALACKFCCHSRCLFSQ